MSTTATPGSPGRGLARLGEIAAALQLQPTGECFYFLRHGQTARNALRVFQALDEPLDKTGQAQAAAAALLLAKEPVATMVCSDTVRTRQTAAEVSQALGLPPAATAGLRERNFGELIGTSSANLDWDCAPAGGELLDTFVLRTRDALQLALAQTAPVLVIAHGGTLHVLATLLRIPLTPGLLANALPLRFDRHGGGRWTASTLGAAAGTPATTPNLA